MQFLGSKWKKILSTLLLAALIFSSFVMVLQIDIVSPVEMVGLSDAFDKSADEPRFICGTPMYNDPEYLRTMVTYMETEGSFTFVGEPMNTAPSAIASGTVSADMVTSLALVSELSAVAEYGRHVMCKDVDEWNPVDATTTFLPSDDSAYLLMTVTVVSEIKSVWYSRNDNFDNVWDYYGEVAYPITDAGTYNYYVGLSILGNTGLPTSPRGWRIEVYLDGLHSFNEYFEITEDGWQSVTCEDVDANEPVNIKDTFTIGVDSQVGYYLRLYDVAYYNNDTDYCHDYLILWYRPDDTLFTTWGPSGWSDYKDTDQTRDYWAEVIRGGYMTLDSGTPTGQWRIETYIDTYYDGGETWYPLTTTTFTVQSGADVFYYKEYNQLTGTSTQKSVTANYYGQTADGNFEIYYDQNDPHIDSTYLSYVADAAVNSWSELVPFLGSPYDEDGDGLIEVLIVELNKIDETTYGGGVCGYVQSSDANGLGLIYLDNDLDLWLTVNALKQVLSHEFTHRIQLSYDPFEEMWIMEGMAQFGSDYVWPFSTLQGDVNIFQSNPDMQLTAEEAWYCADYVFFEYIAEEYGTSAVRTILERTSVDQGKQAVENAVGASFDTLFNGFAVKNYANDYTGTPTTFEGIDIFAASIASHTVFPASGTDETNLWATDYVKFTTTNPSLNISFSGDSGRAHNVRVIKVVGDFTSYSFEDISLTDNQGSITIADADTYSQIALMTTRHEDAYGDASWSYGAEPVEDKPVADFTASPLSGDEPLTVEFTDLSTSYDGIVSYEWDFGDETTSTEQSPTHMYNEGTYTVTLTVEEADGDSDTETKTDLISVSPTSTQETHLVVRGSDDGIYYRPYNSAEETWGNWIALPGSTCDSPAAAVYDGKLYLVVRGMDGNSLWYGWINLADDSFSGWTGLSGATPSKPTLVSYGDELILVVRGMDNRIYYRFYGCISDEWYDWIVVPTGTTSDSIAATVDGDYLHLVVRGMTGGLYHQQVVIPTIDYLGWSWISGETPSAPVLASNYKDIGDDHLLYLIVRGTDDGIYLRSWDGTWNTWSSLPGGTNDAVGACIQPSRPNLDATLHVVVRGTTGGLYHGTYDLNAYSFVDWTWISGETPSPPTLTS